MWLRALFPNLMFRQWSSARKRRAYRKFNPFFERDYLLYQQLGSPGLAFDVGANRGDVADVLLQLGWQVVCFEPDRSSVAILRDRFQYCPHIHIEPVGIGASTTYQEFYVLKEGDQLNTFSTKWKSIIESNVAHRFAQNRAFATSYKVPVYRLDESVGHYGIPDLIKIDVEGSELSVLKGLSHPVRWITFECNLPEFIEESWACLQEVLRLSSHYRFNIVHEGRFQYPGWLTAEQTAQCLLAWSPAIEVFCSLHHDQQAHP